MRKLLHAAPNICQFEPGETYMSDPYSVEESLAAVDKPGSRHPQA